MEIVQPSTKLVHYVLHMIIRQGLSGFNHFVKVDLHITRYQIDFTKFETNLSKKIKKSKKKSEEKEKKKENHRKITKISKEDYL